MTPARQEPEWPSADDRANGIAQAKALREQASKGGLRFEAYLPPTLAEWLLNSIEQGVFTDPAEAVFVLLGESQELEPHLDLRRELRRRQLQAAMDDPRPSIPDEEVVAKLQRMLAEPRAAPATWAPDRPPSRRGVQRQSESDPTAQP